MPDDDDKWVAYGTKYLPGGTLEDRDVPMVSAKGGDANAALAALCEKLWKRERED